MNVTICDVGPRDGLQNQPVRLAPDVRAELVNLLAAAGVPRIEATSFVSERHVPQMAGADEVVAGIERRDGVTYAGLVVNERGYDRLLESGLDEVHVAFAATDEHFESVHPDGAIRSPLARHVSRGRLASGGCALRSAGASGRGR